MSKKRKSTTMDRTRLLEAVAAVNNKEMGTRQASLLFGVPRSTLRDNLHTDPEDILNPRLGRKPVLSSDLEKELVNYCLEMQQTNSRINRTNLRVKAFELAKENNLPHPFSEYKGKAGERWIKLFLGRHPEIFVSATPELPRLKSPKDTPPPVEEPEPLEEPPVAYTREDVQKFFRTLKNKLEDINCAPHRLYAVDETAFTCSQYNKTKVVTLDNGYAVQKLPSVEKTALVTLISCVSAVGSYVPPMLIFPRCRLTPELLNGVPPGTLGGCHESGWVQANLYVKWLKHFAAHVKPSEEDPVVLVLNGHQNYTNTNDVIETARENFISLVNLPPGSSLQMHPLQVAFVKSVKLFYATEIENWLFCNPQRVVTVFQVAELLGNAYMQATCVKHAVTGFKSTGIFPLSPNKLGNVEFLIEPSSGRCRIETGGRRKWCGKRAPCRLSTVQQEVQGIPEHESLNNEYEETPLRRSSRRKRVPARAMTEPTGGEVRKVVQEKGSETTPRRNTARSKRRKLEVTFASEDELDNVEIEHENADVEEDYELNGENVNFNDAHGDNVNNDCIEENVNMKEFNGKSVNNVYCCVCGGPLSQSRQDEKWTVCEKCYAGSQSV